ncbi:MAG: response regulator transcription factor [Methylococcales bacterium]|nr:response regulator transcription factor [Methylococcales bacterium]
MRLLVAQDERRDSAIIERRMLAEGFDVDIVTDGEAVLWRARTGNYTAIILDILLPKINGYDICQSLRNEQNTTPILVLTTKSGEFDEVEAFELGADDYMRKPFSFAVLLARIHALLQYKRHKSIEELSLGSIRYTPADYRCWYKDHSIELTDKEASVLEVLLRAQGEVVPKEALIFQVWGMNFDGNPNIADVYVGYIRRKFAKIDKQKMLKTVRGVGYRLLEVGN